LSWSAIPTLPVITQPSLSGLLEQRSWTDKNLAVRHFQEVDSFFFDKPEDAA